MSINLYHDIACRTESNIYIGVVGPVRTGKSTFIKRFMETMVIPNIDNNYLRERAKDELPQSGSGKTIMTSEPKFVPEEAVSLRLDEESELSVRLIDCVGYMINGASGRFENGEERMVSTPWYDNEISMTEAAEIGTHKVIADHSTIGLVITTDGTVCGIPREDYIEAETRVIEELKAIGKPFIVLVNSAVPDSAEVTELCFSLSEAHGIGVFPVNCKELTEDDIISIIRNILYEFPTERIEVELPSWVEALSPNTPLLHSVLESIRSAFGDFGIIKTVYESAKNISNNESIECAQITHINMGTGVVHISVNVPRTLYFDTIKEQSGFDVSDDGQLLELLKEFENIKADYDKISAALKDVRTSGYGVVMPSTDDIQLNEPEIIKQGGKYSVKLKVQAPSIHMIMTNVETCVSPVLGGEGASHEIMNLLLQGIEGDIGKVWNSDLFGKSLYEMAEDSVQTKLSDMSTHARSKFQETLQRVVNEGAGGLICIIL